jgi:hydrogenase maturation protease
MSWPKVLVACIGNIFLGDDGFGTEVARRLAIRRLSPEVIVRDFGIRGIDLTYALLDPYELVILVDACPRGGAPGTVYLIEPDAGEADGLAPMEAHSMNPVHVLRAVKSMGGAPGRVLIVGCEPADLGGPDGKLGLSEPVQGAIEQAVALIEGLAAKALAGGTAAMAMRSH